MKKKEEKTVEIDLTELLRKLWHKLPVIVLTAVLLGSIVFYHSAYRTKPVYKSSALMYVNNSSLSFVGGKLSISPNELAAAQSLVDTYSIIATSRTTLNEVISRAHLNMKYEQLVSMVSVSSLNNTEIFKISVKSTDPRQAEYIANTIADVLPDTIAEIVDGASVRVVDYAVVPNKSVSPDITRNTLIGMLVGAFAACGVIVLLEITDDTVKGKDYLIENYDIPILSVIPAKAKKPGSRYAYRQKKGGEKGEIK